MKKIKWLMVVVAVLLVAAGCSSGGGKPASAAKKDQNTAAIALGNFQTNQPVPVFNKSQLRQNLIDIETAQSQTTQTTTLFYNQGVAKPVWSCPSIGFPIASTDQLTNPQQVISDRGDRNGGNVPIPQIEANGVYTGDSSGTYVICVNAQGQPYAFYWEGFVGTITGPATVGVDGAVTLTGPPSFAFKATVK